MAHPLNRVVPLLLCSLLLLGWLPDLSLSQPSSVGDDVNTDPPHPITIHKKNHCIWYGQCNRSVDYGDNTYYNCYYNGPPYNVTYGTDFYNLLKETCPTSIDISRGVCCDMAQLKTLAQQISLPRGLFKRCPACLRNFIDHFCLTTCDPDQALWMNVTSFGYDAASKNWNVEDVHLYVTKEYSTGLYNSCENVQYTEASARVIDIMCGTTECDDEKWLTYLGDPTENHESPFPMEYYFGSKVPDGFQPKTYDFIECNTTDTQYQCSCTDCDASNLCPPGPQPSPNSFPYFDITVGILCGGTAISFLIFFLAMCGAVYFLCTEGREKGYRRIDSRTHPNSTGGGGYGAIHVDDTSPTSSVSINDDNMEQTEERDDGATHISPLLMCCQIGSWIEYAIKLIFYKWGKFVAQFWYLVFFFVGVVVIVLCCGLLYFEVTSDPVELWSAKNSRARQEKAYFDKNFNPFYRTEMMIITAPSMNYTTVPVPSVQSTWEFGPVLDIRVLTELYHLQDHLTYMPVLYEHDNGTFTNITLSDICFSPLAPDNTNCTIMSVLNYFQNDYSNLIRTQHYFYNFQTHIAYCARNPTDPKGFYFTDPYMPCLGAFGGPVDPNLIFGGFNKEPNGSPNYQNATALIVTFTVNNHLNESDNRMAETWEKAFLDYLENYTGQYINITYSAERSIEDEIERESKAEVITILISYLLMFVYITVFLGHIRSIRTLWVDLKLSVGFFGVLMVLVAVLSSIGLLSYIGVMNTLIIIEVVPFLVLAVGVDNLFILVHSYERVAIRLAKKNKGDLTNIPVKEIIGIAVGEVAPSLLLTSFSETAAFLLGGVSNMPAVRSFSFYAGVAIFFNFALQISVIVGVMAIDAHRQIKNRVDVAFCVRLKGTFDPQIGYDIIHTLFKYFAKFILNPLVRPFVLLIFGLTSTAALTLLFRVEIGLDQTLALPKDSYLIPYFNHMYEYLHSGSPVYFVIKEGFDYTNESNQNLVCSGANCSSISLGQQISTYSKSPNLTRIAEPAMLWLDTYFEWIDPTSDCCGITKDSNKTFCNPKENNITCAVCPIKNDRPNVTEFETYIYSFLHDNPGLDCALGGHAAFGGAVILDEHDKEFHRNSTVLISYAMTYHTTLKTSDDFISAVRWARKLADNVSLEMKWEVFPYSVFYVFYEQYLTTVHDMALNIGLSIAAVTFVTFLMFGLNIWATFVLMMVVCMIILHMFGCMYALGINANAVSLVNLVMTVGIAVEFCSHTVRWFVSQPGTRLQRAHSSLDNMGASVFSGITVTKFLGVFVLLFAKSRLFNIYYFRMYMLMLIWGALHGLVFLPVLLSYIGPPYVPFTKKPYKDPDTHHQNVPQSNGYHSDETPAHDHTLPPTNPYVNQPHPQLYPTLPSSTDYQGYGPPTYPRQQQVNQQGVVVNSNTGHPDENSKLISN